MMGCYLVTSLCHEPQLISRLQDILSTLAKELNKTTA